MMKKIYYIPFLIAGALLIFITLPITNYYVDQWRVLHHDYKTSYRGISPNKSFLKVTYLLDNKVKYDTILMGSSRSGYMDARLISDNAYNMKFNFALAAMHLHNLKLLLDNDVKIKKLWLGINDYIIWKNPEDHEFDFQRKTYKDNFFDQLDTYSFYLLKSINDKDIKILKGQYRLTASEELTKPDKTNMETAYKREKYAIEYPAIWTEKMSKIKPTLLGYNDDKYRIEQAILEIKEIKRLCQKNNIELTIFFYPSYYKTYLSFNQYKIEEFKRKLVSIVDFYDFYELNEISLDDSKWQDSSHFHASIGDFIIKSIFKNNFLVTKENIENRINETRGLIEKFVPNSLPIEDIYKFNQNIPLGDLKEIFSLANDKYQYFKNDHFSLKNDKTSIQMTVKGPDPIFIFDNTHLKSQNIILKCVIDSPVDTWFKIFYKKTSNMDYNENDSWGFILRKGVNKFNLLIPSKYMRHGMRVDMVDKVGTYKIKDFSMYKLQ